MFANITAIILKIKISSCNSVCSRVKKDTQLSTLDMSSNARWTILPSFITSADLYYRINKGYSIALKNPVILNVSVEFYLIARSELNILFQCNDLLDQQQSVNLVFNCNSIKQRRTNRIGRYVLLRLNITFPVLGR